MNEVNSDAMNFADRFRKAAIGHANAAIIVHQYLQHSNISREDSTWVSLQNLIGLAAESAFKAYLVSRGLTDVRKRKVGHNLILLHQMCVDAGLRDEHVRVNQNDLSDALGQVAEKLGPDHGRYNYRYIEGDEMILLNLGPATDMAIAAIQALTDIVEIRIGEPA